MELTYTQCGDYLIPDLVLSDTKEYHIGKYGRLRRAYLKEHRPILYTDLIVTECKCQRKSEPGAHEKVSQNAHE